VWLTVSKLRARRADEHEAASADVAGSGVSDSEGEGYGNRGVDRVAAGAENLDTCVSGVVLDGRR
jgi:hypothetical protein